MARRRFITGMLVSIFALSCLGAGIWWMTRPILIGVVVPLETSLGNEENLFFRYADQLGFRLGLAPLKFLVQNPKADETAVKQAYRELDQEGVVAIVGGVLSQDGAWLAAEAETSGIPTLGITASSALLSGKKDGFFRFSPTNDVQAKAVGQYYEDQGVERLSVVYSPKNLAYAEPYLKTLRSSFSGQVSESPYVSPEGAAEGALSSGAQALFCILPANELLQVISAVRKVSQDFPLGSASWGSVEILSLYSGPLLDDVLFFSLGLELKNPDYGEMIKGFEASHDLTATNGTHYALSLIHLLKRGMEEAGATREGLKNWLEGPRTYETAYGAMAMDEMGDVNTARTVILHTVQGALTTKTVLTEE